MAMQDVLETFWRTLSYNGPLQRVPQESARYWEQHMGAGRKLRLKSHTKHYLPSFTITTLTLITRQKRPSQHRFCLLCLPKGNLHQPLQQTSVSTDELEWEQRQKCQKYSGRLRQFAHRATPVGQAGSMGKEQIPDRRLKLLNSCAVPPHRGWQTIACRPDRVCCLSL